MRVRPPLLARWMISYVRTAVRAEDIDVEVGNKEPDELRLPMSRPLIVIREDPGSRLDWTTFDRTLAATIIGSTKQNPRPIEDLAVLVASIMFDTDLPLVEGCQIARVDLDGCNGPYAVPDRVDVSRQYLTAQYVASGSW